MKLLLINPNTSDAMTGGIAQSAQAVAAPGTQIIAVHPTFGPLSIEGHYDEAFAAAGVAEQVRFAQAQSPDAIVIACFGDPGLEAAREATRAPVLGIAEAAFHAASMLATGFSIVTTMTRTCIIAERLVQRYGFEHQCRGVHGTDIAALSKDRSGAIVLGCAGMSALCHTLTERLGVPVIDGVTVAVKFAEALAALGLGTSKQGDYATPLPKTYTGWAAPLGWPG